jgi:hypothetical protein
MSDSKETKSRSDSQKNLNTESLILRSIRQKAQPWANDWTDYKGRESDKDYLCSQCKAFPMEKCYGATIVKSIWTTPPKRLMKHGNRADNGCMLCRILLQALCRQENDPIQHPQVLSHLQDDFIKHSRTMARWLTGNTATWPFGKGDLSEDEKKEVAQSEGSTHKLGKLGLIRGTYNYWYS